MLPSNRPTGRWYGARVELRENCGADKAKVLSAASRQCTATSDPAIRVCHAAACYARTCRPHVHAHGVGAYPDGRRQAQHHEPAGAAAGSVVGQPVVGVAADNKNIGTSKSVSRALDGLEAQVGGGRQQQLLVAGRSPSMPSGGRQINIHSSRAYGFSRLFARK